MRTSGFNGPDPIRPRDMLDWSELTGTVLRPEERSILLRMDASFRAAWQSEADDMRAREAEKAKQPKK